MSGDTLDSFYALVHFSESEWGTGGFGSICKGVRLVGWSRMLL